MKQQSLLLLKEFGRMISFKKNEMIFNEESICHSIGFVQKGCLEIRGISTKETEYTIKTIHEQEFFGNTLLFSQNKLYLGNGIAKNDCEILFFSKEEFLSLLRNYPLFLEDYLTYSSDDMMKQQEKIKVLCQETLQDKILLYLTCEEKRTGKKRIIYSTKEELAKYFCVKRPSLSRELIRLKKLGIIDFNRHELWITN